ncbi:protein-disulfide isomerase, contains CxxC motif [Clostridium cavendishii DSM 21758]|uniref:Protein-disulfide isomerase, contains CxxC motif n=1 Tax=Clostridium cavendishii DSM 21758 TaxID=1121302 RepID=A0A1M6UV21_9CLOT|nr:DsbA family protein [Clostridium cavendishii]SHK73048.1 protein-disulfide isomerase, contains CxxC motif [Clostridium cavendishii DSM 21758]
MKTKIYYVMDPMCGWYYGFGEVIEKIHDKYKEKYDFTILPGSKAILAVQTLNKNKNFEFLKRLQQAMYIEGKEITNLEVLADIVESIGISKEKFIAQFKSKDNDEITSDAFKFINEAAIGSFPSLIAYKADEYLLLSQGYTDFNKIDDIIANNL